MWDAETYDQVSATIQQVWGKKVVDWRNWQGNEKVMDAGCGTGRLSKVLAEKVPSGIVYAVDIDNNMIRVASTNLEDYNNVRLIRADLTTVKLPSSVDVIFSNATIHWIMDHRILFENFWTLLNEGGEMIIQCGGHGNLNNFIAVLYEVIHTTPFCSFFAGWKGTWYFPKADDTSRLLNEIGFKDVSVHLSTEPTKFENRNSFALFAKTVVMKPFLAVLPDLELKKMFVESALDRFEKDSTNDIPWVIDYVRLNVKAKKN